MDHPFMLSERRLEIAIRAMVIEMLELWARAVQPPHRIPEAVIQQRVKLYFRQELTKAVAILHVDSSALSEVLVEILELTTGLDEIPGWQPSGIQECLEALGKPL